ncbi:hypothetical protein K525DRAFT_367908 [Schizophyllum commune Loenen D]|nr:hypothetical protein K525DRAFT_367908 [Schizophyllum commune Loenen D]
MPTLPESFDPFANHPFTNGSGVVPRPPPPHAYKYAAARPDLPSSAPPPASSASYPTSPQPSSSMHIGSPPDMTFGSPNSSYMGSPPTSSYMGSPPLSSPPTSFQGSPPASSGYPFATASPGYPYPPSSQYHPTSQYPPTSKYPAQDAECRGRVLAPSFMRSTPGGKHHGKDGEKQLGGAGSA